jgi:hypothetical protein
VERRKGFEIMSKTSSGKAGRQLRVQRVVSRRRKPKTKLYEITAIVTYATVIVATSEADAMEHVKTWEQAWAEPSNADLVGVSDVSLSTVRERECDDEDWQDEAHDRTCKAANDVGQRLAP